MIAAQPQPPSPPTHHNSDRAHIPPVSRFLWSWFAWYAARFVQKHFHAVRLCGESAPQPAPGVPLIVYLNHPSWWDPLTCILLAEKFWADRRHYGPIDARMLGRYRFFGRLGFFGVEQGSPRGGVQFLRAATAILAQPSAALWLTAEGAFTDVRHRPICLRPGLAHLLRRLPEAVVLPVAIEYPFWGERTPELLIRLGRPIHTAGKVRSAERWNALLTARLQRAMDELAELSTSRDAARFQTLIGGTSGSSPVYDAWRYIAARATGRPFTRDHADGERASPIACTPHLAETGEDE